MVEPPELEPLVVDWDELQQSDRVSLMPIRSRNLPQAAYLLPCPDLTRLQRLKTAAAGRADYRLGNRFGVSHRSVLNEN